MKHTNEQRTLSNFILLGAICLLPLTSIWMHLPQAITLAGFGFVCFVGSFAMGRSKREETVIDHASTTVQDILSTPVRKPVLDVLSQITAQASLAVPQHAPITNAFSIDLEDYFHTEVACKVVPASAWETMPSCIERSTMQLLDLLDRSNTRATIFVLGWVARKHPHLVRHIQDRGHEVACHSDRHRRVHTLTPAEFLEDTRTALDSIQEAGGTRIQGYRAPSFSITEGTEWAFEILADLGFTYDSSVYPVYHPTYGNPQAMRFPYYVADCRLLEIPVATWRLCGINLPVGGGAYLRVLPERYIRAGLRAINEVDREPAMLYVHPWEIDPIQPRLKLKTTSQLRQTVGLHTMAAKLERLLTAQNFAPIEQVYSHLIPQWHIGLAQSPSLDAVEVHA